MFTCMKSMCWAVAACVLLALGAAEAQAQVAPRGNPNFRWPQHRPVPVPRHFPMPHPHPWPMPHPHPHSHSWPVPHPHLHPHPWPHRPAPWPGPWHNPGPVPPWVSTLPAAR
jgi:hypothetical protein